LVPAADAPPAPYRRRPAGEVAGLRQSPALPITQVHLVALAKRVQRRVIRWFRLSHLLDMPKCR
jgi:hypothetical protein